MTTTYYYSKMNKQQQAAYYSMLEGLKSMAPSFMVPRLEGSDLFTVHFLLRLDHPEIFYAESMKYKYYENSSMVEVVPDYLFDKKKIKEHKKAMESRVEKLARPAMKLSDEEKVKYIHDFICDNVTYDKLKKQYSHEIIGPLGQGVGVCEGIAKSVKILADALGLWCMIPISEANSEKNIKYRHAWNIIKINGKLYHLDVTFDNSLCKETETRYDYFMLSDKQIFRDHQKVVWEVPECTDNDNFYYKKKKLSFTKLEEVQKRSLQAVKKGRVLTFNWRGGYLTKDVLKEIVDIIEKEAASKEKHARISVNIPQAVIRAEFNEKILQQEVFIQEADEGNLD